VVEVAGAHGLRVAPQGTGHSAAPMMGAGSLPRSGISAVYAPRPSVCTLPALLRTAEPAATPQRQARRPRRARNGETPPAGGIVTLAGSAP
jgi:hypothetical protein